MDETKKAEKVVKCEARRSVEYPHGTYVYITMLADLVHVLSVSESALSDAVAEDLAEEALNAVYMLRTGAEV